MAVRRRGPEGQRIQGVSRIFAPRVVSILTAFAGEASGRANVTEYWAVMLLAILASIESRPDASTALSRSPPLGEAVRLAPRDADGLARLAYCELELGRTHEARTHAAAALALNPADPLAAQLIAVLDRLR